MENIPNVDKNRSFSVELVKSEIAGKNNIKLILRGNGDDGLYVLSKKNRLWRSVEITVLEIKGAVSKL
ncbi:MAG: hypothetical protein HC831_16940 [Chloroflexia bacterium]|nr:hypothetical protein [Chloroflexia bacterium]